ncbi:MAG: hypothetical protein CMO82_12645 [Winogradskyella sp.]|nr:hypothetical protein [Winogradskyella sp.]|tara:strand:+ start:2919 stop:3647 length:729 start_codon:yes stop_codon:yes gene_type:complete
MESIGDFYDRIYKNFLCCSALYLPRFLAEEIERVQKSANDLDVQQYADTVFVLDQKGHNFVPEKHELPSHVVGKKILLEDNLFLLLQKRDSYLPETFAYIFKKYCQQFAFYLWLVEWLDDNLKTHITDCDEDAERTFRDQRKIFSKHKEELWRMFRREMFKIGGLPMTRFELNGTNKAEPSKDLEEMKRIMIPKTEIERKRTVKSRREKITELKDFTKGYADELILERVFNMKQDSRKNHTE